MSRFYLNLFDPSLRALCGLVTETHDTHGDYEEDRYLVYRYAFEVLYYYCILMTDKIILPIRLGMTQEKLHCTASYRPCCFEGSMEYTQ